ASVKAVLVAPHFYPTRVQHLLQFLRVAQIVSGIADEDFGHRRGIFSCDCSLWLRVARLDSKCWQKEKSAECCLGLNVPWVVQVSRCSLSCVFSDPGAFSSHASGGLDNPRHGSDCAYFFGATERIFSINFASLGSMLDLGRRSTRIAQLRSAAKTRLNSGR